MVKRLTRFTLARSVLFLVASCGVVVPASAQPVPPPPHAGSPDGRMARLLGTPYRPLLLELRGVNLTREQRQQVIAVLKAHRPELKAVQEKLHAARAAWQQAGKIDIEQRKSINQERLAVLQAAREDIFNLVTPEQKARIEANRARRRVR